MEIFENLLSKLVDLIPSGITIIIVVFIIWMFNFILNKRYSKISGHQFRIQMLTLIFSFVGLLVVILSLPISESTIGQLLSLIGILLSAAIALSATTFVGNIMAGLMLRAVKNFKLGDFLRVSDYFGRVSERGLFHIEIQTEDRDLTTLPNMYLVINPVKVIRSSGTLVSAEVSLGYDVPQIKVEASLVRAANEVGLQEPFVHVITLGDYSVVYRLSGLLLEVKSLLSTRSNLRKKMLDALHQDGVEIVSPTFMNQRVLNPDKLFIPKDAPLIKSDETEKEILESIVFDKADEAESLEKLHERHNLLQKEIELLKSSLSETADESTRLQVQKKIDYIEARSTRLIEFIAKHEQE